MIPTEKRQQPGYLEVTGVFFTNWKANKPAPHSKYPPFSSWHFSEHRSAFWRAERARAGGVFRLPGIFGSEAPSSGCQMPRAAPGPKAAAPALAAGAAWRWRGLPQALPNIGLLSAWTPKDRSLFSAFDPKKRGVITKAEQRDLSFEGPGTRKRNKLQGSLHYTPEHCLLNGGCPLFWWKKPGFKLAKCIF